MSFIKINLSPYTPFSFLNFSSYQNRSRQTASYPNMGDNFVYPALGLDGEAGEVAEKVKKIIRDRGGVLSGVDRCRISDKLGDVLWYVAQVATELGLNLDDIAQQNLDKLNSCKIRNTLHGEVDERL